MLLYTKCLPANAFVIPQIVSNPGNYLIVASKKLCIGFEYPNSSVLTIEQKAPACRLALTRMVIRLVSPLRLVSPICGKIIPEYLPSNYVNTCKRYVHVDGRQDDDSMVAVLLFGGCKPSTEALELVLQPHLYLRSLHPKPRL